MKKRTLIIVITLIALMAVVLPVAAQGNGWFLSDPVINLYPKFACEEITGNLLTTATVDYSVPNGHVSSATMTVSLNGVVRVEADPLDGSGVYTSHVGGTARFITVTFLLQSRGVSRTSETTFTNPCFTGGVLD